MATHSTAAIYFCIFPHNPPVKRYTTRSVLRLSMGTFWFHGGSIQVLLGQVLPLNFPALEQTSKVGAICSNILLMMMTCRCWQTAFGCISATFWALLAVHSFPCFYISTPSLRCLQKMSLGVAAPLFLSLVYSFFPTSFTEKVVHFSKDGFSLVHTGLWRFQEL